MADQLVDQFQLMKLYGAKYHHEARTALAKHTSIEQDRKTNVIEITVSDRDPSRAALIANAYATELEHLNTEMNTSGAHMERVFIEARMDEVNKELHEAATRLSQFSSKYSVVDSQQGKSTVEAALLLQGQVNAAEAQLKGLEEIYTPQSPNLLAAKARIAELRRQLRSLQGPATPSEIPTEGILPSIRNLPSLGVSFGELYRKSRLLEAEQVALAQQLELAKTEEVKLLPAFRVMDPAEVPEQRVFPKRTLIVLVSTLIGFLAAITFVLGAESWSQVSSDDPMKVLIMDAAGKMLGPRLASKSQSRSYSPIADTQFDPEKPRGRG